MVHFRTFSLAFCVAVVVSVLFLFCSAFHKVPLLLNASGGGGGVGCGVGFIHLLVPSSSCGFVLVSIS